MKTNFPLLANNPNLTYLDTAATSQKPQCVIDAISNFYATHNANPHRGIYPLSVQASQDLEDSRKTIAEFFNTTQEHIVFTKNTTESVNLLSRSIKVSSAQNIVITEIEHHSNFVPWQEMSKRNNCELRIAKYDKETHTIENVADLVDENTKIVSFVAMSNVSGQIFDVEKIVNSIRGKNKDTIIIVDACQWAVHETINLANLDTDYLVCSTHKMYGPLGIGILYAKSLENLDPFLFGGDMIESVSLEKSTYAKGPTKFEAGTLDMASIVGSARAIKFIQDNKEELLRVETQLTQLTVEMLQSIQGIKIIGHQGEKAGSIISFYHETLSAFDIAHFCANDGVCIRVGQHCAEPFLNALNIHATMRISLGIYNTPEDLQKAKESIENAIKILERK